MKILKRIGEGNGLVSGDCVLHIFSGIFWDIRTRVASVLTIQASTITSSFLWLIVAMIALMDTRAFVQFVEYLSWFVRAMSSSHELFGPV
jgi:hypothetical protein